MEGAAVLPPGSVAHADHQHAVLPVSTTVHPPLREPGWHAADDRQPDELVERQREPQVDAVAETGRRQRQREPGRVQRRGRKLPEESDRGVRQESGVSAFPGPGAGGADRLEHEGRREGGRARGDGRDRRREHGRGKVDGQRGQRGAAGHRAAPRSH